MTAEPIKEILNDSGVPLIESVDLPAGVDGFNQSYNGYREIILDAANSGPPEFRLLHELREVMEVILCSFSSEYQMPSPGTVNFQASRFAAAVLAPLAMFRRIAKKTGLDPCALREKFPRPYAAILLRLQEVFGGRLPLLGAIYEPDAEGQWRVKYSIRTHGRRSAKWRPTHTRLPKGAPIRPGSPEHVALQMRRPMYCERLPGTAFFGVEDLTVIVRPVLWGQRVAKIISLAVQVPDGEVFRPQVDAVAPLCLDGERLGGYVRPADWSSSVAEREKEKALVGVRQALASGHDDVPF